MTLDAFTVRASIRERQWFIDQVKAGRDSIARGEGVPHAEAMANLRKALRDRTPA